MNPIIKNLFRTVELAEEQNSADAINALCCLLEKTSWNLSLEDSQSKYETYIPQEVIELEIEQQEEEQIVSFFQEQISKNHRYSPSILFSMGKASYRIAFKPLVNTIKQNLDRFEENEVYQAIISLERILFFDEDVNYEDSKKIFEESKLLNHLSRKLLSLEPISHASLRSNYGRFLARIILLLDGEDNEI